MENKVLITGIGLLDDYERCDTCRFDCEWINKLPELLLLTNKILIPTRFMSILDEKGWPKHDGYRKSVKFIIRFLEAEGFIEIIDTKNSIITDFRQEIFDTIERDRYLFMKNTIMPTGWFESNEVCEAVPCELCLDGEMYCAPISWSIYASLILAMEHNAYCSFSSRDIRYLNLKTLILQNKYSKILQNKYSNIQQEVDFFSQILKSNLPYSPIVPEYFGINPNVICSKEADNLKAELDFKKIEMRIKEVLSWRRYDEIEHLKLLINRIKKKYNYNSEKAMSEIKVEIGKEQIKANYRIHSVFPKAIRWSNIATMISIPVALVGLCTKETSLIILGATVAGSAKISKELLQLLSSKYQWLNLFKEK